MESGRERDIRMWAEYLPRRFRVDERPGCLAGETYVAGLVCLECGKSFYHRTLDALRHIDKKHGADWVVESRPAQEKAQREREEYFKRMDLLRPPKGNPAPKYVKVYFVNKGKPVILRDPISTGGGHIRGHEVDEEGQLASIWDGQREVLRDHFIHESAIRRVVPMVMSLHYGELEEVPRENPEGDIGFSEMAPAHQEEIVSHLGAKGAKSSRWRFVQMPVCEVMWIAKQAADLDWERVESVMSALRAGGSIRPILIAEQKGGEEESSWWIEGQHRAAAAEELGIKEVPVFVKV